VLDDRALETVAALVTASLRNELQALSDALARAAASPTLTVEQVALRLGVSRSTVYAHWREWGGYKLGASERAPIRFDSATLPAASVARASRELPVARARTRTHRRRRRDLITDAPRLAGLVAEMG